MNNLLFENIFNQNNFFCVCVHSFRSLAILRVWKILLFAHIDITQVRRTCLYPRRRGTFDNEIATQTGTTNMRRSAAFCSHDHGYPVSSLGFASPGFLHNAVASSTHWGCYAVHLVTDNDPPCISRCATLPPARYCAYIRLSEYFAREDTAMCARGLYFIWNKTNVYII